MTNATADYPNGYVGAEYVSHKRVRAAKIVGYDVQESAPVDRLRPAPEPEVRLHFDGEPALVVRASEVRGLEVGGYLVQYVDGYRSFSPAKAFEEGYTRVEPPKKTGPVCEGCGE